MKKYLKYIIYTFIILLLPIKANAIEKTETIYSNLKADGTVSKTVINNHLSGIDKGDVIDYTNLDNIENINGREKFTKDSDKITWKSTGRDIYYQGKINASLPITIKAKYYLNDEEVDPKKIINKKGNIRIELEYINNEYNYNYGMYVPYVVSATTTINNKNNSNINITNGKTISLGEKTVVTAIASPGLYESTNIKEFNNLNKTTITYETKKFENINFYFITTPKLLDELDLSKIDEINSKVSKINTLKQGVNQLEEGSNKLYQGTDSLSTGAEKLNKGLESAYEGSLELTNGLYQVNNGIESIASIKTLVDTLYNKYNENNGLLTQVSNGINQIDNGLNQIAETRNNLESQLDNIELGIVQLEAKEYDLLTDEEKQQLETLKASKTTIEAGLTQVAEQENELIIQKGELQASSYKLQGANEAIASVLCGIIGTESISSVNEETISIFKNKLDTLSQGVSSLYNGSHSLSEGLNKLSNGSKELYNGTVKLTDGTKSIKEGIGKLNKEGMSNLENISNKVNNYSDTIVKLSILSKEYSGFSSNNSNHTIFIYKLSTSK